jgi:Flp pilus assembly protein TadD
MTAWPRTLVCALLAALALPFAPFALGGYSFDTPPVHPDWEPGIEAIQRSDWSDAVERLAQVVRNEPDSADAHAMLGLAYHSSGDLTLAFSHYHTALRIAPGHRLAHRNLGEAYLASGDKAKAERHLARLLKICGANCEEYQALRSLVAGAKR